MNGATGVPDGNFTLVAGYGQTPWPLTLEPSGNSNSIPWGGNAWVAAPNPLPSPMASPKSATQTLWGITITALAPHTTYTVEFFLTNLTVGCPASFAQSTFTTL
jgi:hypothetical protein